MPGSHRTIRSCSVQVDSAVEEDMCAGRRTARHAGLLLIWMMLTLALLLIAGLLHIGSVTGNGQLHLTSFQWQFQSRNGSMQGRARVPGDIYQDLFSSGYIPRPLFDGNDQLLRWIPRTDWIYNTTFIIPRKWNRAKAVLLNARGLDTAADVYFNDALVLKARNQFVPYLVALKSWKLGKNRLRIEFKSPIAYAQQQAEAYQKEYGHIVPPFCPVPDFHGECHVNFMRKIQASFSWDWGPSFPTVGISEPLSVEGVETFFIDRISAVVSFQKQHFSVQVRIPVWSAVKADSVQVLLAIPELSISYRFTRPLVSMNRNILEASLVIPNGSVERWWPNGHGKQKLYDLTATLFYKGREYHGEGVRVGFRTVEMVQDYVDKAKPRLGRHFYFKINGRPIFLKGSNWIPLSAFPARNHRFRERFLLESVREANMNTLRVWGGGRYETDRFYNLADEMGLLIWQDMMFACALYPVDDQYLDSVRDEIQAQVGRLGHHPSIFLWAGNNENEVAVRQWFSAEHYSKSQMVADYMKLYNDTVRSVVNKLDSSRPFLLSSPTNGIDSEKEGGVAMNPGDERYGDIHFYNEYRDLWADETYMIPRCSSEYGVQSFPRKETMLEWLNKTDWQYTSEEMRRRQHHPYGFFLQLTMIFSHFKIPSECGRTVDEHCSYVKKSVFMDRFVYLSQFHQAIAYQVQTEHYRRWRGRLTQDGRGNTMCALYWQLNDLWAAPTWSTIDYELSWKPAHYFARRFFAPVILSMYLSGNGLLQMFVVSDLVEPVFNATVILEMFSWFDHFVPIYASNRSITILPQISTEIPMDEKISRLIREKNNEVYVVRGRLLSSDGGQIGYDAVFLPDKLFKVPEENFGTASIEDLKMKNETNYELEIRADKIAPFVYLELAPGIVGWLSDNAFTMTEPRRTVILTLFRIPKYQLTKSDVTICSLRNCGIVSA